jgi:serine/threonine-protein kinase
VFCPHCGAPTYDEARFCAICGKTLPPAEGAAATIAPAVAPPVPGRDSAATAEAVTRPPASDSGRRPSSSSGWLTGSDSISHGRFAPGAILDGRFRVIGLLGKGGMGEVYRADDLRLGQAVALKFLPDTVGRDPVRLAQFHNEVRTARQVSHPNICRVYDIGEIDGHLYLSMEFVDGEDLATSLRRIGRFPEDRATDVARQLCAGLAAAHERGVLHRDLKPANVMIDDGGKVRLMDFGLAAVGPVEDVRAGTPAYMAPEQLLGREVTAKSDIYALGLVLYEIFTGRRAFAAATLNDLIEQHQSGQLTPPHTIVAGLDPAIERAILRCLDPDPAKRPLSALAVAAALPGGDPLAAALAAGETPSPEMVAAAGEGTGLSRRVAYPVLLLALAGMAAVHVLTLRVNPLIRLQPELTGDVLAQKAREMVTRLGYADRPQDEAYAFAWDDSFIEYVGDRLGPDYWATGLARPPSPLLFNYRRSQTGMVGITFHTDLLTPGMVTTDDPPPIESGMMQLTLDHTGLLRAFEAIPPQREDAPQPPQPLDWSPLLILAGLDPASLQAAEPRWNWLATSDVRAAWTGSWPGGGHELRVEAAALHGRPVAFLVLGPWSQPWRTPRADSGGEIAFLIIAFTLATAIVLAAGLLARRNMRDGRGDRRGAQTLSSAITVTLWVLWLLLAHFAETGGMLGIFLLAIVTTTFYGALFLALYLALEPFVRRYWPQTLVSWTTLLSGRASDAIVGRDVLFGVLLGVVVAVLIRGSDVWQRSTIWMPTLLLDGPRATAGHVVLQLFYGVRTALFCFFLLFLLRTVLRRQIPAAAGFVAIFAALNMVTSDRPLVDGLIATIYFAMFAAAVLRWGLTTLSVGLFVGNLLLGVPTTASLGVVYAGPAMLLAAIPIVLAAWAFYTSLGGRLWSGELLT